MPYPRYLLPIIYLCGITLASAQQPQLTLRHYTTDQGLPSSEVHEVLQDSRGYLWFGADNGLSRFNGYEFRNYSAVDGLTDSFIFRLQEDHRGWIWIQTISGKVFYYEPKQDIIHAFWGNREIKKLQGQFISSSAGLQVDSTDVVHIVFGGYGILKFLPDSSIQAFRPSFVCNIIYQLPNAVLTNVVGYHRMPII